MTPEGLKVTQKRHIVIFRPNHFKDLGVLESVGASADHNATFSLNVQELLLRFSPKTQDFFDKIRWQKEETMLGSNFAVRVLCAFLRKNTIHQAFRLSNYQEELQHAAQNHVCRKFALIQCSE